MSLDSDHAIVKPPVLEVADGANGANGAELSDTVLLPEESFAIGQKNPPPETEEPFYYEVNADEHGALTVGPFQLTAEHIKTWSASATPEELNALVERRQLRASTAQTVKSDELQGILRRLEAGEKLDADTIKKFIPGDLQRVIARKMLNK